MPLINYPIGDQLTIEQPERFHRTLVAMLCFNCLIATVECGLKRLGLINKLAITGWPRHRENREFGSYFFQTGKLSEFCFDTGKIFFCYTGKNLDTGKIFDCDY